MLAKIWMLEGLQAPSFGALLRSHGDPVQFRNWLQVDDDQISGKSSQSSGLCLKLDVQGREGKTSSIRQGSATGVYPESPAARCQGECLYIYKKNPFQTLALIFSRR